MGKICNLVHLCSNSRYVRDVAGVVIDSCGVCLFWLCVCVDAYDVCVSLSLAFVLDCHVQRPADACKATVTTTTKPTQPEVQSCDVTIWAGAENDCEVCTIVERTTPM